MEINGVANIDLILQTLEVSDEEKDKIRRIHKELNDLNRYMVAVGEVLHENNLEVPKWHEVRDNPDRYPTLRQKIKG